MGGVMPFGGVESGRTERECEALARVRANAGTPIRHHGKLAATAASADRAPRAAHGRRHHEARRVQYGKA